MRDHTDRLDQLYTQLRISMSPHWQLQILAEMARVVELSWTDDPAHLVEAAVVVGTDQHASAVVPERRRAVDTWPVYLRGLFGFPLSPASHQENWERTSLMREYRRLRG